ncbi:MAG TPA: cytochrome c [Steroidobacteraceae bacterium]|nr:cytochrome c [Steroidobacteraceae bacterium]
MRNFLMGLVVGVLILPAAFLTAAWLGRLPVSADSRPPRWEIAVAHMALDAAAARNAPHLANPIAPTEANLMAGVKLFEGACAGCHGTPATALSNEAAPDLYPSPPQFALHHPSKPDYQLFWIAEHGVRYSGMFVMKGAFRKDASGRDPSDEKIWTLVTFLTHLDALPPAVAAEWQKSAKQ